MYSHRVVSAFFLILSFSACVETKRLQVGRVYSESLMTGFTYEVSTYRDVVIELGEPDSIIIKGDYFLASWRGASVESIGVSLLDGNTIIGTSALGATRSMTIIFDRNTMRYKKYIIDTDPIRADAWVTSNSGTYN